MPFLLLFINITILIHGGVEVQHYVRCIKDERNMFSPNMKRIHEAEYTSLTKLKSAIELVDQSVYLRSVPGLS